jgi:hypothetical protein
LLLPLLYQIETFWLWLPLFVHVSTSAVQTLIALVMKIVICLMLIPWWLEIFLFPEVSPEM